MPVATRRQIFEDASRSAWQVRSLLLLTQFVCDKFDDVPERDRVDMIDALGRVTGLLLPNIECVIEVIDDEALIESLAVMKGGSEGGAA